MSGRKNEPKTRFVCRLPGQTSELFWVRENSTGGLLLKINSAENYTPDAIHNEQSAIKSQKYSVHRSNDGVDTTMHHTIVLADGTVLDSAAYQENSRFDLCWPIFAKACPDLSNQRYALNSRECDATVIAAEIGKKSTVLIYCVVISSANMVPTNPGTSTARFTHFNVTAICRHLWLPAAPDGTLNHVMTNSPRKDNTFVGVDMRAAECVPRPSLIETLSLIDQAFSSVQAEHVQKLRKYVEGTDSTPIFDQMPTDRLFLTAQGHDFCTNPTFE